MPLASANTRPKLKNSTTHHGGGGGQTDHFGWVFGGLALNIPLDSPVKRDEDAQTVPWLHFLHYISLTDFGAGG